MVSRAFVTTGLVLALATGGAAWWHRHADQELAASFAREIRDARDAAAAAANERDALAVRVAQLEAALAATTASGSAPQADAPGGIAAPAAPDVPAASTAAAGSGPAAASVGDPLGSFDPDRLVAAGFHRQDVERFRARLDEIEMKRLYLRDRAARESWLDTPRFLEESRALLGEYVGLREEFDDPLYDWMLYASGHPNRVAVHDVLAGSAGESAGLQPGDLIVRYDEQLVLSAGDLREATIAGRPGEWVAVEVQREGESAPRRILVPRGPIGVTLAPATVQPAPAG